MEIVKYTHACVRLVRDDGGVLVIDPGEWSEPEALAGADAVLLTHEHSDHVDVLRLAGLGAEVHLPAGARIEGLSGTEVRSGESFSAAGFRITAIGGRHATVHNGQPDCVNLGYLVDDDLYHPGDSLALPDCPVDTLLVPVQGSWLKTEEAIDFLRAVAPRRAFGIHDAQVNERGLSSINSWYASQGRTDYRWLSPGETA